MFSMTDHPSSPRRVLPQSSIKSSELETIQLISLFSLIHRVHFVALFHALWLALLSDALSCWQRVKGHDAVSIGNPFDSGTEVKSSLHVFCSRQ
jgi:hypothetical protein